MKLVFQKFWLSFLSLILLWANLSFDITYHFCGSRLISISLQKEYTPCCKTKLLSASTFQISKKSCCHNSNFQKKTTDQFRSFTNYTSSTDLFLLAPLPVTSLSKKQYVANTNSTYSTYRHPYLQKNRFLLYEVFLI